MIIAVGFDADGLVDGGRTRQADLEAVRMARAEARRAWRRRRLEEIVLDIDGILLGRGALLWRIVPAGSSRLGGL